MMQKIWITRDKNNGISSYIFLWKNKPEKIVYTREDYKEQFKEDLSAMGRLPYVQDGEKDAIVYGPEEEERKCISHFSLSVAAQLFGLENIEKGSCGLYNLVTTCELL